MCVKMICINTWILFISRQIKCVHVFLYPAVLSLQKQMKQIAQLASSAHLCWHLNSVKFHYRVMIKVYRAVCNCNTDKAVYLQAKFPMISLLLSELYIMIE